MAVAKEFEDLSVWKTARELTNQVYQVTNGKDFKRDFGLNGQIQRSAVSVMSNIAEGFGSRTPGTFVQFLGYARRSAAEVQSQLYVALDQNYIKREEFDALYEQAESCSRQLHGFIKYLMSVKKDQRVSERAYSYAADPRNT